MPFFDGEGQMAAPAAAAAASSSQNDDPVEHYLTAGLEASGRSSLFCCLACGMPFAFPDSAYTSDDADVREVISIVHKIRNEVRHQDPRKGMSTMLWQVGSALCGSCQVVGHTE